MWAKIEQHVNVARAEVICDEHPLRWFLDPDVQFPNPTTVANLEPLMSNTAGSLQYRPEGFPEIPNLFLAPDYGKTYLDVACTEAANRAARRTVNALLDRAGSTAERATRWPLREAEPFKPLSGIDQVRFRLGQPHAGPKAGR